MTCIWHWQIAKRIGRNRSQIYRVCVQPARQPAIVETRYVHPGMTEFLMALCVWLFFYHALLGKGVGLCEKQKMSKLYFFNNKKKKLTHKFQALELGLFCGISVIEYVRTYVTNEFCYHFKYFVHFICFNAIYSPIKVLFLWTLFNGYNLTIFKNMIISYCGIKLWGPLWSLVFGKWQHFPQKMRFKIHSPFSLLLVYAIILVYTDICEFIYLEIMSCISVWCDS